MKHLVVISGAGLSAESGLKTFRDADGLWENHHVMEVASIGGWIKNPSLVLEFYNQRRAQLLKCQANHAHRTLAELEKDFKVSIITQNVDDLHERAGSTTVLHLHGELLKVRSSNDPELVYNFTGNLSLGDLCEKGSQLRPDIVWFGEEVPRIDPAIELIKQADIVLVVGTSLIVYPAAGLIHYAPTSSKKFLIDPVIPPTLPKDFHTIEAPATVGIDLFKTQIYEQM